MSRQKDDRQRLRIEALLSSPVVAPLKLMIEEEDKRIAGLGILSVHGPITNGAIYRRHGLFKYELTISAVGHERLSDKSMVAPDTDEALLDGSGLIGYRLARLIAPTNDWVFLIQVLGYMAEIRKRAKNSNTPELNNRIRQLKAQHKGHTELQMRDALGKTVH